MKEVQKRGRKEKNVKGKKGCIVASKCHDQRKKEKKERQEYKKEKEKSASMQDDG